MPANVEVLAIKRAEGGEDTVIRLQERSGVATSASLKSGTSGLNREVALRPWELKTLIVKQQPGGRAEVRESNSIET